MAPIGIDFVASKGFEKSSEMLSYLKSKRDSIPMIIGVRKKRKTEHHQIKISWDMIQMTIHKNKQFGKLFRIDFGNLKPKELGIE